MTRIISRKQTQNPEGSLVSELNTKVTILERDHERFMVLFEKMDTTLNKLTELTSSIKEMLAVQENRLDHSDDRHSIVEKRLEKHSDRLDALENWKWYLTGIVALCTFVVPFIITYLIKNS